MNEQEGGLVILSGDVVVDVRVPVFCSVALSETVHHEGKRCFSEAVDEVAEQVRA